MAGPTLILDCNYLCRRAQHSVGNLAHGGERTGTLFGFLTEMILLHKEFQPSAWAFCFDVGGSVRRSICPTYKNREREDSADEEAFQRQVHLLRDRLLSKIGYSNVFHQPGYEADDLIASLAGSVPGRVVIVSSDRDLFQLVSKRVTIWQPQKRRLMTLKGFRGEFGIKPDQWADVKAIGGCRTDGVPGVDGVGEITALKYIRGELDRTCAAYKKIRAAKDLIHENRLMVRLPFPGTGTFDMDDDIVTTDRWDRACERHGLKSLLGMSPGAVYRAPAYQDEDDAEETET